MLAIVFRKATAALLLPSARQDIGGFNFFTGFAGKRESRRADLRTADLEPHYE
jgi:hypothetical protein